ncbi:MAG: nucleotidyl transferase AbiEii/AbiGii toxin family protein [Candidatus Micrarchaeota archaeon]
MKKLIDYLSSETRIGNKGLIEKDILLHNLLIKVSQDDHFKNNLVFKGGTCLIKCYFDYYRFSEDLDFSWINQSEFKNKSQKEIRRILSQKIDILMNIFAKFSEELKLEFKPDKTNNEYVELGRSNKFVTFKIWYKSAVTERRQFIKIQINFVELFQYGFNHCKASSIIKPVDPKEFEFLFPEYVLILSNPELKCYDVKEILIEKFRAILTRKGVKARDFIDIFLIAKKEKIDPRKLEREILEKIRFALKYEKYLQNLENFKIERFVLGEEEKLILKPIPEGFEEFLKSTHEFLDELYETLRDRTCL